jgi:hypothetical protein
MKKLILSVGLILLSFSAFSQTSGFGVPTSTNTPSTNLNGSSLAGALGGALGGAPTVSPTNSTSSPSQQPGTSYSQPQQMQERTLNPNVSVPQTAVPAVPDSVTQPKPVPSATGVGTGAPTTY